LTDKPSFFAELKRRNVLRAATFYAASAWLLVQIATQVFPFFHVDDWIVRWIVIAAVIGFPFAMLFSWFYEWTPQGIQRESEVEENASITHETGKKLERWTIAILGLAVVLLLANQFVGHKDADTASAPASAAPGKSVAVLPFENLSDDKSNAYFSDGITEEILDALAQIPNLKVAARSSAFQFKSGGQDLHKVGLALGVANVLEGSVQKVGDQVRINVQLVDAQTGLRLWSQKYDRKLDNVFAVEDDISKSIATQLRVQLTGGGGQPLVANGTTNSTAHDLYLHGLTLIAARGPGLRDALDAFKQAVALDPKYAQAWGALAETEMLLPGYHLDTIEDALPRSEAAAEQALAIDPDTALAYVARGTVRFYRSQWAQADQDYRRALVLAPGDAETVDQYAQFLSAAGQFEPALREIDLACQLDPLSPIHIVVRIGMLDALHRYDEATAQAEHLIATHPDFYPTQLMSSLLFIDTHRYPELETQLRAIAVTFGVDPEAKALLARGMADPAQRAAALKSLETSPANAMLRDDPLWHAYYLMALGDKDHALDQLELYAVRHNSVFVVLLWDKGFDPLRNDPRFKAALARIGLPYTPTAGATP
jgi:TolB-like protein/Tfp pilus assembly protein PilF